MDEVEFRVLGPVEVRRRGRPVALGGTVLALLAGLLVSANEVVSAETMAEWAWGEDPPAHPRAALHNAVARLRRQLGRELIRTETFGYRLVTSAEQLDLLRFNDLTAAAADAVARGASEAAAALLAEALSLWRGLPLANVASPALRRDAADGLAERHLSAQDEWARQTLLLGRHAMVVRELSHVVRRQPLRETTVGLLMLALFRSGRRAEALKVYESLRGALHDALGTHPGAALQDLHVKILRSDSELHGAASWREVVSQPWL